MESWPGGRGSPRKTNRLQAPGDRRGRGRVLMAGTLAGYLLARTVGMFGFQFTFSSGAPATPRGTSR